jgi:adenylosuccinate lyase
VKGATGTQASFLTLFDRDASKVKKLEELIAHEFGFTKVLPIAGQTYTRKIDLNILNCLESFAASTHKIATDIRLLAHENELAESFTENQVGSSAMPYKRNPIYSERICGMARFVMSLSQNPAYTLATQWLERSLDDSSNRRLSIPEAFLGADGILNLFCYLLGNLKADRALALTRLEEQIPHLAMETILMQAVKNGEDRQEVHESLRKLSGKPIAEIAKKLHLDPKEFSPLALTGRAADQVRDFLKNDLNPYLEKHKSVSAHLPFVEM